MATCQERAVHRPVRLPGGNRRRLASGRVGVAGLLDRCASNAGAVDIVLLGDCGAIMAAVGLHRARSILRVAALGSILVLVALGARRWQRAVIMLTYVIYSLGRRLPALGCGDSRRLDAAMGFHWPTMLSLVQRQSGRSPPRWRPATRAFLPQQPIRLDRHGRWSARAREAQIAFLAGLIGSSWSRMPSRSSSPPTAPMATTAVTRVRSTPTSSCVLPPRLMLRSTRLRAHRRNLSTSMAKCG